VLAAAQRLISAGFFTRRFETPSVKGRPGSSYQLIERYPGSMTTSIRPVQHRLLQDCMVTFTLIGIGDGERPDGFVEGVALAEVPADLRGRRPRRSENGFG
jgi:hypothetical protein